LEKKNYSVSSKLYAVYEIDKRIIFNHSRGDCALINSLKKRCAS